MKKYKVLRVALLIVSVGVVFGVFSSFFTNDTIAKALEKTIDDKSSKEEIEYYERPEVKTADEALELLKEGNKRFVQNNLANIDLSEVKRKKLIEGQNPFAVIIGCSDSRVPPELIFDQGLGDLFVIRVAGNVLDKDEIGSIEYAIKYLNTPLIVVMGHENCGAVTSAVEHTGKDEHGSIGVILDKIQPAIEKAKAKDVKGKELIEEAVKENILNVSSELMELSPIIKEKVEKGEVKIVSAKYMISTGEANWLSN